MPLKIPKLSLVVLIGPSGAGKSTFARQHFRPTEILSSDACRAMVSDDENNQNVTTEAFALLHAIAEQRLKVGKLTVVDATNVQPESRAPLVSIAKRFHCLPVAIVLNLPEEICQQRNLTRADRAFGPHVIRNQRAQLRRSIRKLEKEGFRHVHILENSQQVEAATIVREPLWNDKSHEHGPFDLIGDVHGCADELKRLLEALGYQRFDVSYPLPGWSTIAYRHAEDRKAVFVGDLVDRGPKVIESLSIVRNMMAADSAICVPGNHDMKLLKKLRGRDVQITHGLAQTLAEIDALPAEARPEFTKALATFLDSLVSHYLLDDGKLVVAHAGMKAEMQGRGSARVRDFALYGETTGETDEFGLPVRHNWAAEYRGAAMVVYGHTPVPEPLWLNNTVNIDTGCVFGGKLTALRYPEREIVSVPAAHVYCEPSRPFLPSSEASVGLSPQHAEDSVLDLQDVTGKRIIMTRLCGAVTIREAHAAAALEVMSRFAVNPKWLVYLPPTMSPSETSPLPGFLEHPLEAFTYFRNQGCARVICEEKHMGSRAVVVLCKDRVAARACFGVEEDEIGVVYTRTGRRFFNDLAQESEFLARLRDAATRADLWNDLNTTWLCLDCELMPWSAKAQELVRTDFASVATAGLAALPAASHALAIAASRLTGDEQSLVNAIATSTAHRVEQLNAFAKAYRHYCWPVKSLIDLKLAPFHLLASEGGVHVDKDHLWHMQMLTKLCAAAPEILRATPYRMVNTIDPATEADALAWWTELTTAGGEGMVAKPLDFLSRGPRGLVQPGIKCRGPEYLRLIYGPEYTNEDNLTRLRKRGLGLKRSLARSEFALGIEALERFVRREPLRRVHECVFGVLAMESEPVDPRL
jgi:protein phosphatase